MGAAAEIGGGSRYLFWIGFLRSLIDLYGYTLPAILFSLTIQMMISMTTIGLSNPLSPRRPMIWLFLDLNGDGYMSENKINLVNSSWPLKSLILTYISMKVVMDSCAGDTH